MTLMVLIIPAPNQPCVLLATRVVDAVKMHLVCFFVKRGGGIFFLSAVSEMSEFCLQT